MSKTNEKIAIAVLIIMAIIEFMIGFVTGIPKSEFFFHWETVTPLVVMLIIIFLLSRSGENTK